MVGRLNIDDPLKQAVITAAMFHDHGKRRAMFQKVLGNFQNAEPLWAKSGTKNRNNQLKEYYRHEFGSLLDLQHQTEFKTLKDNPDLQDLILHLIAVHHGYGRPHFPEERAFDPEPPVGVNAADIAAEIPRRFARLQRKHGRWGLAYLESLLRAADWAASANPSAFVEEKN
jgi:CRISPR-associated endonuclease/helicase Cas3